MENIIDEIKISYSNSNTRKVKITNSLDSFNCLITNWEIETIQLYEEFKILLLNTANEVLGIYNVSKGGISSTIVEIRHILYIALKTNSTGIILAHNHPSGNLKPSSTDINLTRKIKSACEIMDLKLQDHIILAKEGYLSFMDEGIL